jgi:hypothetical protein
MVPTSFSSFKQLSGRNSVVFVPKRIKLSSQCSKLGGGAWWYGDPILTASGQSLHPLLTHISSGIWNTKYGIYIKCFPNTVFTKAHSSLDYLINYYRIQIMNNEIALGTYDGAGNA